MPELTIFPPFFVSRPCARTTRSMRLSASATSSASSLSSASRRRRTFSAGAPFTCFVCLTRPLPLPLAGCAPLSAVGASRSENALARWPRWRLRMWNMCFSSDGWVAYARMYDRNALRAISAFCVHISTRGHSTVSTDAIIVRASERTCLSLSTHRSNESCTSVARSSYSLPLPPNPLRSTLSVDTPSSITLPSPSLPCLPPSTPSAPSSPRIRACTHSTHAASLGATKLHASPPRPARAVRPTRCTYSVAPDSVGRSYCTTARTSGRSSPRDATDVQSRTDDDAGPSAEAAPGLGAAEKPLSDASRVWSGSEPCRR